MEMIQALLEAGRAVVAAGLVQGNGGNLSCRHGAQVLITRSGAALDHLGPADLVAVPWPPPAALPAFAPHPSSELPMHLAAYQAVPQAQAVVHVHPPHALALGLAGRGMAAFTPDFYLHLGPDVPLLPYITPTTEALAQAVAAALGRSPALILQNHGVLAVGASLEQALLRVRLLEEHAGILLAALAAGAEPRLLSPAELAELDRITGGRYKYRGPATVA